MGDFAFPLEPIVSVENKTKSELAQAYHLASALGLDDIIFTHFSTRVPGCNDQFYINPFGFLFEEIHPDNLITVDFNGKIISGDSSVNPAGNIIHSAIYEKRPDVNTIMHVHSPNSLAVASLKDGLLPLSQFSTMFYNRVAYHDFEGISLDAAEKDTLNKNLGQKNIMLMKNHGLLIADESIPKAFMKMYYLEQSCELQLKIQSSGQKFITPSHTVCEKTATQFETVESHSLELAWHALLRRFALD